MSSQSGKIVLILVLLLLLLGAAAYFLSSQTPIYSPNSGMDYKEVSTSGDGMKDYYSENLKISFRVPEKSSIEEKFVDIKISLPDGEVFQTRIGTNFSSSKDYFADLRKKNNLLPKSYNETTINGRDVVVATLPDPNDRAKSQKTYFIYDSDAIYTFYSSDETLYPVLDQIVQSFEYKP